MDDVINIVPRLVEERVSVILLKRDLEFLCEMHGIDVKKLAECLSEIPGFDVRDLTRSESDPAKVYKLPIVTRKPKTRSPTDR